MLKFNYDENAVFISLQIKIDKLFFDIPFDYETKTIKWEKIINSNEKDKIEAAWKVWQQNLITKSNYDLNGSILSIFIKLNDIFYPLPFIPNSKSFDFESINYMPTKDILQLAWQSYLEDKNLLDILQNNSDFKPQSLQKIPNWEELQNRLLAGELYPLFQRLTIASLAENANAISTARGDISNAILIVRVEAALISGLQLLTQVAGYTFTEEEKFMWNATTTELGFSASVHL